GRLQMLLKITKFDLLTRNNGGAGEGKRRRTKRRPPALQPARAPKCAPSCSRGVRYLSYQLLLQTRRRFRLWRAAQRGFNFVLGRIHKDFMVARLLPLRSAANFC